MFYPEYGNNSDPGTPKSRPVLVVLKGSDKGKRVVIDKARFIVGRKMGDLLVSDSRVSSAHLALELQQVGYTLLDLDSTNGTTLNGKRVKIAMLNSGDEIGLGSTVLKFMLEAVDTDAKPDHDEAVTGVRFNNDGDASVTESVDVRDAEGSSNFVLKIIKGPETGKIFPLKLGRTIIGRVNCEVDLDDKKVARKHAVIEVSESREIVIKDISTKEGLFVNNRRVLTLKLKGGETIQVGDTTLQLFKED